MQPQRTAAKNAALHEGAVTTAVAPYIVAESTEADMSRLRLASVLPLAAIILLAASLGGCVEPPPPYYSYSSTMPAAAPPVPPAMPECREMHLSVMIGNQPQDVVGTACRQPDGTWRIRS
jgi:hypothetical protein